MANSKLLLIQDVEDLGRSGDIVTVRPGFARNYLLPGKLAVMASVSALKMQARLQEERKQQAIKDRQDAESLAAQMVDLAVTATVKVDHEGHMYGSVSAHDIVELILDQAKVTLDKKYIQLKHPIKEIGTVTLPIKLKEGVTSAVTVNVVAEEAQNG